MVTKTAGDRRAVLAVCLFLTALTWLVFAQTVRHDFINFDDDRYVYENAQVRSGLSFHGIAWAFTHAHANLWHPLTTITHMLDCQIFGLWAGGHHLVNVLLHNIAAVLLFLVLRQMTGTIWRSAFVATIFAIHPLRVESVAWVAERKDVLSGVFLMLTLGAYVRYVDKPTLGRYVTMSILFACGLMSKATFVAVPLVLLLLDYWPLKRAADFRAWRKVAIEKIPLLMLSAASAAATAFVQTVTMASLEHLPLLPRIKNAVVSAITYTGQTFWPLDLGIFYPHPDDQLNLWLVLASTILILGISLIALFTRRKYPYVLVGWCWYLGMLIPVLGFVQAGLQGHADRFTYLPHIGLLILLTWAIADLTEQLRHRRMILGASAAVVIAALSSCAWRQTTYWRDSVSIWTRTLAVTGDNSVAHQNLAAALWDRGRIQEAHTHSQIAEIIRWQTVLKDYPLDIAAHNALGVLLAQSGKPREAIAQWEISLEIDPNDGNAQNDLAWVLASSTDDAICDGRRAVELAEKATRLPGGESPIVLRTLAAAYAEAGDFPRAIEAAQRAAELAMAQQNQSLVERLQNELELYRVNKPHRETPH
jgi:tetratricopeptide (TPR) repeat protein